MAGDFGKLGKAWGEQRAGRRRGPEDLDGNRSMGQRFGNGLNRRRRRPDDGENRRIVLVVERRIAEGAPVGPARVAFRRSHRERANPFIPSHDAKVSVCLEESIREGS